MKLEKPNILHESVEEDYTTWDRADLETELKDVEGWLSEVSDESATIFYGHRPIGKGSEYEALSAEREEYEKRREAILNALAKKGTAYLAAKTLKTDFLGHEVPDTQVREYLTADGGLSSNFMDYSASCRPHWFTSEVEINKAIEEFKQSKYYNSKNDKIKIFTRDSYLAEKAWYAKTPSTKGKVAMRIVVLREVGQRSIPKSGTAYFSGDPMKPVSPAPYWFNSIKEAEDLWAKVDYSRLKEFFELDPLYKFLADKYDWDLPKSGDSLDAITWLRKNGIYAPTPEEEEAPKAEMAAAKKKGPRSSG